MQSKSSRGAWPLALISVASLTACSVDVIPVHSSRVKSAQNADKPLERGPQAPGAFRQAWEFKQANGYVLDPSKVEIQGGLARAKKLSTGQFPLDRDRALIETTSGFPYAALDSFSEKTGANHRGQIRYQLSPDGSRWFYHNGKAWVTAGPTSEQANTAQELSTTIQTFNRDVGLGSLFVKAALVSPTGKEPVELLAIEIQGISPKSDGWN